MIYQVKTLVDGLTLPNGNTYQASEVVSLDEYAYTKIDRALFANNLLQDFGPLFPAQSATGPAGPPGPQGPAGPQGPKGDTGATAPAMMTPAVAGPKGDTGPQGPQGLPGAMGQQGVMGPMGLSGPTGAAGSQGLKGDTGATGAAGPTGAQGPKGDAGATGPQGPVGLKGDTGAAGATGATGAQGPKGDPGAVGATGTAGPQGTPGLTGATGMAGPAGQTGPAGATGPPGPIGLTGAQGPTGATGAQGPAGATGATGAVPVKRKSYTGGTLTVSSASWTDLLPTTQDLAISAAIGDVLELGASFAPVTLTVLGSVIAFGVVSVVSATKATLVNNSTSAWIPSWMVPSYQGGMAPSYLCRPLVAADLVSGVVTVRLQARLVTLGTARTISADTATPFDWWVKNRGSSVS